jgi:hypothetical protein
LLNRNDPVGLHIQLMNGKSGIFGEEAPDEPLAAAPDGKQTEKNRKSPSQQKRGLTKAELPPLAGTQLDLKNMVSLEPAVF